MVFGGVEGEDLLVDVDEGDVVEAGVLGLHVVLGPEEFDYAWSAEHLQCYN